MTIQPEEIIREILGEICHENGHIAVERFPSIVDVEAKQIEFRLVLTTFTSPAHYVIQKFDSDPAFHSDDIKVRLYALRVYCESTLKLLQRGILKYRGSVTPMPGAVELTEAMPFLDVIITERWEEAQRCMDVGAYTAAVFLMGSILDALLLARAKLNETEIARVKSVPRQGGKPLPVQQWSLTQLISACNAMKWISVESDIIPEGLTGYRNLLHPWSQTLLKWQADQEGAAQCWKILNRVVNDLLKSL